MNHKRTRTHILHARCICSLCFWGSRLGRPVFICWSQIWWAMACVVCCVCVWWECGCVGVSATWALSRTACIWMSTHPACPAFRTHEHSLKITSALSFQNKYSDGWVAGVSQPNYGTHTHTSVYITCSVISLHKVTFGLYVIPYDKWSSSNMKSGHYCMSGRGDTDLGLSTQWHF